MMETIDCYTKSEMETLYEKVLSRNSMELETYTVYPDPNNQSTCQISFTRLMSGIIMIYVKLQDIPATAQAGDHIVVLNDDSFPRKFRPAFDMFFMASDNGNHSRCVGVMMDGQINVYNGAGTGCYGFFSFVGMPIQDTSVASYYRDSVYKTVEAINRLDEEDWSSFVIITDTHGSYNSEYSQNVVRFILDNSKARRCFWLGDTIKIGNSWPNGVNSQYIHYSEKLLSNSNQIYFAYGNHDRRGDVEEGSGGLVKAMYNDFLCDKGDAVLASYHASNARAQENSLNYSDSDILSCLDQYYYFIDDASTQTRYMVINTSQNSKKTMDSDHLTWIQNCVRFGSGNEDWNLVILGHINIDGNSFFEVVDMLNAAEVRDRISRTNGRIVGYFCGHQHVDYYTVIPAPSSAQKSIPEVIFTCDKNSYTEGKYEGYPYPPERTRGTIGDQAVTVVSFNRTTGQVVLRRIGAETPNMTTQYNYLTNNM